METRYDLLRQRENNIGMLASYKGPYRRAFEGILPSTERISLYQAMMYRSTVSSYAGGINPFNTKYLSPACTEAT